MNGVLYIIRWPFAFVFLLVLFVIMLFGALVTADARVLEEFYYDMVRPTLFDGPED